jgi:hypothetical protein
MYEGVDTVILYEELAYQDVVPLLWSPLTAPLSGDTANQFADRNLRLLQACAALEEHGQVEKPDESAPHAADILRLDMKINLLLDLVGRILIANQPRPKAVHIRFNSQGATWKMSAPEFKPGDEGVLEIYLKDCLVEPLRLAGRIANVSAEGQVKVKFHNAGEAIADLIEKLAFRKHRRQVADARQPRTADTVRAGKVRR